MIEGIPTPVLLIIFNRPELTRRVLEAIAVVKPARLFVAADGPRGAPDVEQCREARAAIAGVDWECELLTDFSDINLGCGIRVHTAVDWAFSHCDQLMVLEDDCVPGVPFFRFCEQLLEVYRDDERIMHISGNNFHAGESFTPYSYYFSKYTHAWGWATWRRAWRHFDWAMKRWPEVRTAGLVEACCSDPYEREYWSSIFERMHQGAPDVWDYQWTFACWLQSGLAVLPSVNLVSNLGFGADATHTKAQSEFLCRPTFDLGKIRHPPYVIRNVAADSVTFDQNFGGAAMKAEDSWRTGLRRRVSPALGPIRAAKRMVQRLVSR